MTDASDPSKRLRIQRNLAAAVAALLIVFSIFAVLPGSLQRRHQLLVVNIDLGYLQSRIVAVQLQTRDIQARIIQVQNEIRALQQPK